MIEEIGTITAVDKDHIWVETEIKTTCSGCQAKDNCGTGVVAKAFAPKSDKLIFRCHQQASVGQKVKLGIPEEALLSASAWVYLLPLLVLIGGALLGQYLLPLLGLAHEGFLILFAFGCTAASFLWVKRRLKGAGDHSYQPKLLALLPKEQSPITVKVDQ